MIIKKHNKHNSQNVNVNNSWVVTNNLNITNDEQPKSKQKCRKKRLSYVINIIVIFCTISGLSVLTIYNYFSNRVGVSASSETMEHEEYTVFLFSEYSKIAIYQEINMTATLNFEAKSVSITAHLASGESKTLSMRKKNSTEWEEKVIFNETGIHEIVATAITPDGDVLENSIQIEVIPINIF